MRSPHKIRIRIHKNACIQLDLVLMAHVFDLKEQNKISVYTCNFNHLDLCKICSDEQPEHCAKKN